MALNLDAILDLRGQVTLVPTRLTHNPKFFSSPSFF